MSYFKSFKKNKKSKIMRNFIIIVIALVCLFELIIVYENKLKSEESGINEELNNIEISSKYVVGISKDNLIVTGQTSSWGSGIIVSKDGYIVTNSHVCGEKNSECFVIIDYHNCYKGYVVWSDENLDLAFVKVDKEFSGCIKIGNSDNIKVSQEVFSIGNPINMNFQRSVGKGIVSGLNRNLKIEEQGKNYYFNNLIQTDAMINYGNSGGALVDSDGNLIGISTVKITDADLMGFAIPVNVIRPIIRELEEDGRFEEASLKIWCSDKYSLDDSGNGIRIDDGVFVSQITSDSNSEKSGLRVGDIINYVDTNKVDTVLELKEYIYSKKVGENVVLKINRDNKEVFVNIKLEKA